MEETERRIVRTTRIYARRQRTWFRGEPGIDLRTTAAELGSEPGIARIAAWQESARGGTLSS